MKFALFDKTTRVVRQWQDHSFFGFAEAAADEVLPLPDDFEFPYAPRWVVDGVLVDVAPEAPALPPVPHIDLVEQAKAAMRIQRQPIIGVLDGLQASAIVKGEQDRALAIEGAKQGLRDITGIDLSACATYEDMRQAVKARYLQLAGALPLDVRVAFAEAVS